MSEHVASQIIAAVEARLTAVGTVIISPVGIIPLEALPAIVIEEIEDETLEFIGPGPLAERHRLTFEIFGAIAETSNTRAIAGQKRTDIEAALLGSADAVRLGGLCRPGLRRTAAAFRHEAGLQKPVSGWSLRFECAYQLKTDAPDVAI